MKSMLMFYSDKLIYSNKRKKGLKSITFSLLTIIISLIVALLLTSIIYKDSSLFTKIFTSFFTAPFASLAITNNTISTVAIFAVAAIAFLIAMKCGMFNIGISSQMMFGGATATIIAQHMINMPNGLSQIILLLVSIVAATSIATIIGILKAFLNVNEVVSSIMFNWIIYFIATMMVAKTCAVDPTGLYTQDLSHLTATGDTFNLVFQTSSGNSWLPLIILAIIVIIFAIILLSFTTLGKKIINTGMSPTAAKYAGYSVKLNQILAMLISGVIAGILGVMVYLGKNTQMSIQVAAKTIPQEGFVGISVGLIAMSNAWGTLPVAFLFGMIDGSKSFISATYGVDPTISDTIFGIVVYGSAIISIFTFLVPFKWYLRIFRGKVYEQHYQQYINNINGSIDDISFMLHYLKQSAFNKTEIEDDDLVHLRFKKFQITLPDKLTTQDFYKYRAQVYEHFYKMKKAYKLDFHKKVQEQRKGGK